jgi:iron complex outermembrane receptor protein
VSNYAADGGTVNLGFIPLAAVQRVDILKDGASAIYGADAMAGVVNFIVRTNYQGMQISAYGTDTQHGGGNQTQGVITAGYGDPAVDRFNVFVVASYQKDQALHARDRPFSRTTYRPDEGIINDLQPETFPANIRIPGTKTFANPAFDAGCLPPSAIPNPQTKSCGFDPNSLQNLLQSVERTNVLGGATFQIAPDAQAYVQYLFAENTYEITRNTARVSELFTSDKLPLKYPAGGPFYPVEFAAAHNISGDLNLYYRPAPLGPLTDNVRTKAQHLVAGVQGVASDWDYDATWIYSENTQRYFSVSGYVSESALFDAFATGLVNPFGPSGPEGDALLRSAERSGEAFHDRAVANSIEVKASKPVYALPTGPLLLALGAAARHEQLANVVPPQLIPGDIIGGAQLHSTSGSRSAQACFAELNVPIGAGLEAQLAVRYDRYSDFGGTTNPKVAVRWQPERSLLLRASYGTGFRAPTLPNLYTPRSSVRARSLDDPLRCPTTRSPSDCGAPFLMVFGGNPDLQPETSWQLNLGAVWEPVAGLSLGADYWTIAKTEAIGALTSDQVLALDSQGIHTHVVRGPPDPSFPDLPGPIQYLFQPTENLGNLRTAGVDVNIAYRGSQTPVGKFSVALTGTYVAEWKQQFDGVNYISGVGRSVGGYIPRWRHYLVLGWASGPWGATLAQTFSSSYIDANLNAAKQARTVGSYENWDAQATYGGLPNTALAFGIKNLFDRAPPFSNLQSSNGRLMYDPRYADPRGRLFYAQVTFAFK